MESKKSARIDLDEEELKRLINMYQKALEDARDSTLKLTKALDALAGKEKYKVLTDITNAIIVFYSGDLKKIMIQNYDEWTSSHASIRYQVEQKKAGENAVEVAKNLENQLRNAIEEMYANVPQEIKIDDSHATIQPEDMERIVNFVAKYLRDTSEAKTKHLNKIKKAASENLLFRGIEGHVSATYTAITVSFEKCLTNVKYESDGLRESMKQAIAAFDTQQEEMEKASASADVQNFPKVDFFG